MTIYLETCAQTGDQLITSKSEKGVKHLRADSIFVRACDGKVFVANDSSTWRKHFRDGLSEEEREMVAVLPRVATAND